ncbi:MAG: DUF5107 domain-containing protein [Anaerolineaceae bacterium]|nr:DUF5107 domain-containing protein [Anaerolineaceae bacterium]
MFRAEQDSLRVNPHPSLPEEKRRLLGWQTGYRVLPYRMQDLYSRQREEHSFQGYVLENEYLRATFLPELGGRLVSLVWLPLQRELLHRNPVFQPADLAIRNAWFSGGIEWNIGQLGHTFTTCSPLFAAEIRGTQGEPGLRLYEFERCKQLFWQIDFYLPPELPYLVAYTRVINPSDRETSMYWWTNIAVNEGADVRVLSPADHAIYLDVDTPGARFGYSRLPNLPSLKGKDATYATNSPFANEFFFQCDNTPMPWETALDRSGSGLIEASTPRLKYRKMFCWGMHAGGRHWQEFLSQPGEAYIEIQAGLAPTQLHGLSMPAQSTWDWTQAFGYLAADPIQVHSPDWALARSAVETALHANLPPARLANLEEAALASADQPPQQVLSRGSGWGALEIHRREHFAEAPISPALPFSETTLDSEQQKWLQLLEQGILPDQEPARLPGEWMVQPEWENLLQQSLKEKAAKNWYALLHLGVMRMESSDTQGAAAAWEESIQLSPSAWAYRNLAVLAVRRGEKEKARLLYQQAWDQLQEMGSPSLALTIEYLQLLVQAGDNDRGMSVYRNLPGEIRLADRVQILFGHLALAQKDLKSVEEVLSREYSVIREGETSLTDLWFDLQALKETGKPWNKLPVIDQQEIARRCPPPARIDFRSAN